MTIAQRMSLLRKAWGWSLDDLAEQSGLSKAYLSRLESGGSSPSLGTLAKVAKAYRFTVPDLLTPVTEFDCVDEEARQE